MVGVLSGQHVGYLAWEAPWDQWVYLKDILGTLSEEERRTTIDAGLVKKLDRVISDAKIRSSYGTKGREVGNRENDEDVRSGRMVSSLEKSISKATRDTEANKVRLVLLSRRVHA